MLARFLCLTAVCTAAIFIRANAVFAGDAAPTTDALATPPQTQPTQPTSIAAVQTANESAALWNFHLQNTEFVQGYPAFSARYSGPNSLPKGGETRETASLDIFGGLRLWNGAEAHIDGLAWQGFGIGNTLGAEAFTSGEAYRVGTQNPNGTIARLFIRQTIGFGGDQEDVPDGQLALASKVDVSRLTITLGRFASSDIFDTNSYANSPTTQFMNWAFVNNEAWDYPADEIGFITGIALELNQPNWTLRYGFFQAPGTQNSYSADDAFLTWPASGPLKDGEFLRSWGMVTELERRYTLATHPGTIRFLAFLNSAKMASYADAIPILQDNGAGANISAAQAYRYKYGFGLNWEQEIANNVGLFSRLGWNDGEEQGWMFSDVAYAASLGISVKGAAWNRPDDTFALAGVGSGIPHEAQQFLSAGGLGILAGDGKLDYGWEKALETYYDVAVWKSIHTSLDYQFIDNPAFNRDRGPVSVIGVRVHWEL